MTTLTQNVIKKKIKKIKKKQEKALQKCPQKRGKCIKIFIQTPKKPNSAQRKITKVLLSTIKRINYQKKQIRRTIFAYIPGRLEDETPPIVKKKEEINNNVVKVESKREKKQAAKLGKSRNITGLAEHSEVLIRGGKVRDLPAVLYHMIRGKLDLIALQNRM